MDTDSTLLSAFKFKISKAFEPYFLQFYGVINEQMWNIDINIITLFAKSM